MSSPKRPKGTYEVCRVEIVQYIHGDTGELFWNLDWTEDTSLTQIIGLLHVASAEILNRANQGYHDGSRDEA